MEEDKAITKGISECQADATVQNARLRRSRSEAKSGAKYQIQL